MALITPTPPLMMPATEEGQRVSEAVYWEQYYDDEICYEWNDGVLEAKPMSDYSKTLMYRWFLKLLEHFLRVQPIADIVLLDIGFRLALPHKTTIRRPDIGVIRHDNPNAIEPQDRTFAGVFDLCVESLSDSSQSMVDRDVIVKRQEYEQAGVQEYFILDDQDTHMAFYERASWGIYLPIPPINGDIIQSRVLPGFQFRIQDLHQRPSLIDMSADPVYRHFILPEYQAEKARADFEAERAEQERQRADLAEQEVARLLAQLEALGNSADK